MFPKYTKLWNQFVFLLLLLLVVVVVLQPPQPFKTLLKWQGLEIETQWEILGYCFDAHEKA